MARIKTGSDRQANAIYGIRIMEAKHLLHLLFNEPGFRSFLYLNLVIAFNDSVKGLMLLCLTLDLSL